MQHSPRAPSARLRRFLIASWAEVRVPEPRSFITTINFARSGSALRTAVSEPASRPRPSAVLICGTRFMMDGVAEFNTAYVTASTDRRVRNDAPTVPSTSNPLLPYDPVMCLQVARLRPPHRLRPLRHVYTVRNAADLTTPWRPCVTDWTFCSTQDRSRPKVQQAGTTRG